MGRSRGKTIAGDRTAKQLQRSVIRYYHGSMVPLVQAEADRLRTMPKRLTPGERREFGMPSAGEGRTFQLESLEGRTTFLVDVNRRGKIKLSRCSYLERYRITDTLARLDLGGPPHTNPIEPSPPLPILIPYKGARIECPHFHFFVEGFEARWAIPAAEAGFQQTTDLIDALREFMNHCGVEDLPNIQYPLV